MYENIKEIESKAQELVNCIKALKLNPYSSHIYNTTIDDFYEHFGGLTDFVKSMRPNGYFGMSPQDQKDLDQQQEVIQKLKEIEDFVERNYQKNKDLINK